VEVSVRQFLAKDLVGRDRIFEKVISVELAITKKELLDLQVVLKLVGYRKKRGHFVKRGEPTLYYVINEKINEPKVRKFTLQLSENAGNTIFDFQGLILSIRKNRAMFLFDLCWQKLYQAARKDASDSNR